MGIGGGWEWVGGTDRKPYIATLLNSLKEQLYFVQITSIQLVPFLITYIMKIVESALFIRIARFVLVLQEQTTRICTSITAQQLEFFHILKKSSLKNFIFCVVYRPP